MNQEANEPSLYQRLGGIYPIAAVVDDFIERIMVDPRLNANPLLDEAHHRSQGGVQVPRYRDGWLGHGRSAKVHRSLDGRVAQGLEDHSR